MDIININNCTPFITRDTSSIREILAPRNSRIARQSLAEATLASGCRTVAHSHPGTEEIYYILEGTGRMAIEDEIALVHAGDAVAIPAGERHQISNIGKVPLVFLCCCVPAYSHEDTMECDPLLPPE